MAWGQFVGGSALALERLMTMNKPDDDNNLVKHKYKLWRVYLPASFNAFRHICNYADAAGRILCRYISADKLPLHIYHHSVHQNDGRVYCE
jgi:hypothetical protein